jgi:hypothetical protein
MGGTKMSEIGFLPAKNHGLLGEKCIISNHNSAEVQKRSVRKK